MRNGPSGPSESERGGGNGTENAMQSIERVNETIRARLQEMVRERHTSVVGFISPLPRPIGLLDD